MTQNDLRGLHAHNHDRCIASAMSAVDAACAERGLQLTPVRRRVLEILLEEHQAMGAYDVLARLEAEGLGDKPPVAYRALSFLVDNGFAHRVEKLKAFVACTLPGDAHDPAFMICRSCGTVAEASHGAEAMTRDAAREGFRIESTVVEVEGLCPGCAAA